MKITREKVTDFLSGKGFYLVLAACLIAVGVAGFIAYLEYNTIKEPVLEISSKTPSSFISSNEETSSELPAGTDASEPYSSVEETSSEEEIAPDVIAHSFSSPVEGEVIKGFSADELQFSATYNDMRIHEALDISCEEKAAVLSSGNGIVTAITNDSELGICVEIDHGNGVIAYYCGLTEDINVSEGEAVNGNTIIGFAGEVPGECVDETHIHLEFYKNGKPCDPAGFIN